SAVSIITYGGIAPATPGTISGSTNVCGNNTTRTYSISAVNGAATYNWSVTSGYRIVHPATGSLVTSYSGTQRSISVRFPSSGSVSNGQIRVSATSGGNCTATSGLRTKTVKFGPQTYPVTGPSTLRRYNTGRYTVSGYGITNRSWSFPSSLSPLTGTTSNSIVLEALGTSSGYVTLTYRSCGVTRSSSKYVTISNSGGGGAARGSLGEELEATISGIYPNPAVDVVTVTAGSPLKQVSVMNLLGQTMQTTPQISGREATVDVASLEAGSYLIIAVDEEGKKVHKLVVE
ncbi:MAG TPA: hypothetical protein DCP28_35370, partial [Cytophagales bacterium]|nr:hypothetical protein [Cytophagales bacterium]